MKTQDALMINKYMDDINIVVVSGSNFRRYRNLTKSTLDRITALTYNPDYVTHLLSIFITGVAISIERK